MHENICWLFCPLFLKQIAGHITARPQSIRNGAQYQSIQAAPPYIHPNPQSVCIFAITLLAHWQ